MSFHRESDFRELKAMQQPGFSASFRERLLGAPQPAGSYRTDHDRCYKLVRKERMVVGPTTAPYPINHETLVATSDSLAELNELRDRIIGVTIGSPSTPVPRPESWVDSVPGEKVYTYEIRKKM
ncbi:hypothetical protein BH23CHL2_BH23CHL2_31250 [soil metagenome]